MFVAALLGSALLAVWIRPFFWVFLLIVGLYGLTNLVASIQVALRERDARFCLVMPPVFTILHIGYGLGSLWGFAKAILISRLWKRLLRQPVENSGL
jgi:hypothetical protein